MKILISGAAGFLGSLLAKQLVSDGHIVYGTTRSSRTKNLDSIIRKKNFSLIKLDLKDFGDYYHDRLRYCKLPSVDIVFHLASQQPLSDSVKFENYFEGNLVPTINLLNYYQNKNLKLFVFTSTTSVLSGQNRPLTERTKVLLPLHNYALTKYMSELAVKNSAEKSPFKTAILRLPSLCGPSNIGGIVHYYYSQAINDKDINVFFEGKQLRNIMHVDSFIEVCKKLILNQNKLKKYELFLIGSKNSIKTKQLAELVIKKTRSKSKINFSTLETPHNKDIVIDCSKAQSRGILSPISTQTAISRYINEMSTNKNV